MIYMFNADKKIIIYFTIAYIAIHIIFYPSFYASTDEHEYLYNSYLIQRGSLILEDKTLTPFGIFNGKGYISTYYIGKSIFLIPFTWFGWEAVFLSGLVIHLLNVYIFYRIIKKLGLDIKSTLLFLFYPAFFWNSRTLGNESLVLTFVLVAFYFYISDKNNRDSIIAGIMFSFACLVRYEALILFASFAFVAFLRDKKKAVYMVTGFAPFGALILIFNNVYYGGWLKLGYSLGSAESTSEWWLSHLINPFLTTHVYVSLAKFLVLLSLIYPLMILAPFFYNKKGKHEIMLSVTAALLFYMGKTAIFLIPLSSPTAPTAHLRYLIPVIGLMLITYTSFYSKILEKPEYGRVIFWAAIVILFAGSIYGSYVHKNFQEGRRAIFEQIYANTPEGSLIIGSVDDGIYIMPGVFGARRYLSVDMGMENVKPYVNNNTYVIHLLYKTQTGKKNARAELIGRGRQKMKDFIAENRDSLILVYNATEPHYLEIYKFK